MAGVPGDVRHDRAGVSARLNTYLETIDDNVRTLADALR
jgi:hypothetical protein